MTTRFWLRHRRTLAAWGVVALVFAQALGLVHGTLHAAGFGPAVAQAAAAAPAAAQAAARPDAHGHGLFDGHAAGGAECRLYDQLGHADGLAFACPVLPPHGAAQPPAPVPARPAEPVFFAAYAARAPPRG